jgi:mono/diheme cytochrome c family protein
MRTVLAAAGVLLAAGLYAPPGVLAQAPQFAPRDEAPEDYPAGAGRDDTFFACTACHGFKLVAQQGMNRRQWEDSIRLMVERHNMPPLAENERKVVLDYLEATYPPRAPATRGGWQNPFSPR